MKDAETTRDQWFAALDMLDRNEELYSEIERAAYSGTYAGGEDDPSADQWCEKVARNVSHDISVTFKQAAKLSDGVKKLVEDQIDFRFASGQFPKDETKKAVLDVLDQAVQRIRPALKLNVNTLINP